MNWFKKVIGLFIKKPKLTDEIESSFKKLNKRSKAMLIIKVEPKRLDKNKDVVVNNIFNLFMSLGVTNSLIDEESNKKLNLGICSAELTSTILMFNEVISEELVDYDLELAEMIELNGIINFILIRKFKDHLKAV